MEPIYQQFFPITDLHVDRFGRLKPSQILFFAQEVANHHFAELSMNYEALAALGMFWAVTRHKVQITRLPRSGETIRVETWPMPTTRVAYPRSMVAYDAQGNELFRSITLWVLMDIQSRCMVLPEKSGVEVAGTLRGMELASPLGLPVKLLENQYSRQVCFTDLDRNGHMNNTKYLDWVYDLLSSAFHAERELKEFTVCYLDEAWEGQQLNLHWGFLEDGCLQADGCRTEGEKSKRLITARLIFG